MILSKRGWLIAFAALVSAGGAAAAPAIDGDPRFVISYMKGFVGGCRQEVHGDPDIGKLACACAGAVIVDRFSVDEIMSLQGKHIAAYDQLHAGTSRLIGICVAMAKASVAK